MYKSATKWECGLAAPAPNPYPLPPAPTPLPTPPHPHPLLHIAGGPGDAPPARSLHTLTPTGGAGCVLLGGAAGGGVVPGVHLLENAALGQGLEQQQVRAVHGEICMGETCMEPPWNLLHGKIRVTGHPPSHLPLTFPVPSTRCVRCC